MKKRVGSILSMVALMAATSLTAATPAAAANPYNVANTCGSDYQVKATLQLSGAIAYRAHNGQTTCVVAIKTSKLGVASPLGVAIGIANSGVYVKKNYDNFKWFAGPRYLDGTTCKAWAATAGTNPDPFRWKKGTPSGGRCG